MTTAAELAGPLNAKRLSSGGYMARCTNSAHNDSTASMKFWDGPNGEVMFHCFSGLCDWRDIRAGAERMGLIVPFKPGYTESPEERQQHKHRQEEAKAQYELEKAEQDREGTRRALAIWGGTILPRGTISETYLAGRFITKTSPDIRSHEELFCGKTGKNQQALVCLLRDDITGEGQAVQKIYLEQDGFGLINCIKPKITVGPMAGAAVQLAAPHHTLALAEGPETALSYWQLTATPTWATCGTANLSKIHIPSIVKKIIIAGDNDEKGREAARNAAAIYADQGLEVEIHLPPTEGHDWNNHLKEGGA